jgi:2'-5' RNA ligase
VPRLFFATWPDDACSRSIEALLPTVREASGGKAVPLSKVHMTLVFLGEVGEAERDRAVEVGEAMKGRRFWMEIDRLGAFRRAGVAWAGASAPPTELLKLQSGLAAGLRDAGFVLEDRPFAPHLTLARKIERALSPAEIAPIAWTVDAFTLVRSETGTGRYVVEQRWELGD